MPFSATGSHRGTDPIASARKLYIPNSGDIPSLRSHAPERGGWLRLRIYDASQKKCPPENWRATGGVGTGQYPEAEDKDSDPRVMSELV